nr:uncharacterized protein LOC129036826 [Pongo pygmaeus]
MLARTVSICMRATQKPAAEGFRRCILSSAGCYRRRRTENCPHPGPGRPCSPSSPCPTAACTGAWSRAVRSRQRAQRGGPGPRPSDCLAAASKKLHFYLIPQQFRSSHQGQPLFLDSCAGICYQIFLKREGTSDSWLTLRCCQSGWSQRAKQQPLMESLHDAASEVLLLKEHFSRMDHN